MQRKVCMRHETEVDSAPSGDWVIDVTGLSGRRRVGVPGSIHAGGRRALQLVRAMATLSRADRGGEAEVRAGAKLDSESAANWLAKREAALAENENRRQRREGCLRDSAMTGAAAGTVGASLAFGILRRPAGTGPFRSLLGINVSGKAMGGAMQSFVVWMGFFMPFMLVSNVTRWRCQKAGIASSAIPRSSPAA